MLRIWWNVGAIILRILVTGTVIYLLQLQKDYETLAFIWSIIEVAGTDIGFYTEHN